MGSYTRLVSHVTFSTKNRIPSLDSELKPLLLPYLAGVARGHECTPIIVNAVPDHVHLLVQMPPKLALSEFLRILKAASSRWVHENHPGKNQFSWQEGFGAFSVSDEKVEHVRRYIANQEVHHRTKTFQDEFLEILRQEGVPYDERYIWR